VMGSPVSQAVVVCFTCSDGLSVASVSTDCQADWLLCKHPPAGEQAMPNKRCHKTAALLAPVCHSAAITVR
jgi:hypothetical protein